MTISNSKFNDGQFWVDAFDRAVSTFFQSLAGAVGGIGIGNAVGLFDIDWTNGFAVAGLAALSSLFQSVAFRGAGTDVGGVVEEIEIFDE